MSSEDTRGLSGARPRHAVLAPPDGPRPIESIKVGDTVLSFDPATGALAAAQQGWHVVVGWGGYGIGFGFSIEPLTTAWWLTRPIWLAVLIVALLGVIAVFGRYEPRVRTAAPPQAPLLAFGVVASIVAISAGVVLGFVPEEGLLRWWVVILFAAGVLALGAYPARAGQNTHEDSP